MYKYLEMVKDDSSQVVKRVDITDRTDKEIEQIEDDMYRNLNVAEYSVKTRVSTTALPTNLVETGS